MNNNMCFLPLFFAINVSICYGKWKYIPNTWALLFSNMLCHLLSKHSSIPAIKSRQLSG